MSDLKIQGEVQISAEGAENALDRVGDKAAQMATRLQSEAGKAGAAVDGIGAGAAKSAAEFSRAEGSIAAAIKRATSNLENLGKTASQRLELKISDKGLDAAKFEPLLAKLREVESAQVRVGVSAAQTAAALRGVPAQMTDIVTSLVSGQQPMTVLLQQGGQLKDMFGGAGAAARAIGGYVAGLVNPITLAVATAAGIGYAFSEGAEESRRLQTAITLSGNAAATTLGQLTAVAGAVSAATGATQGAVADVLEQLVGAGKVAADSLSGVSAAIVSTSRATGREVKDLVKEFAELGKSPVDASAKLNEQYNYLTASLYRQIKALEDQGRTAEAAALAQKAYADAMVERSAQIEANLGTLQSLWRGIADNAKGAWDAMLGLGREATLEERLAKARQALGAARAGVVFAGSTEDAQAEVARLEAMVDAEKRRVAAKQAANEQEKAGIEWTRQGEKYLAKNAQMEREIAQARTLAVKAGIEEEALAKRIAAIREKYKEKAPAAQKAPADFGQADFAKDNAAFFKAIEEANNAAAFGSLGLTKLQQAYADLFDSPAFKGLPAATREWYQEQYNAARATEQATEATAKQKAAEEQALKWQQERMAAIGGELVALQDKAKAAEEENYRIGMTAEQLQELTRRRYDEQIAVKRAEIERLRGIDGRDNEIGYIEKQIVALERLKAAEVARPALQQQAQAWQEFTRDIEQSLTDALMRSFEAGDSFGKAFAKNLENMFKTMVLKFAVQAIVGGAGNLLGITTTAGAANAFNTVSNVFSAGGGLAQFYNGFTAGTGTGVWGTAGNWLGGTGMTGGYVAANGATATSLMAQYPGSTGAMYGGVGVGSAAGGTTAGTAGSALSGAAIGLGYFAAMLAIANYFDGKSGGPKTEGDAFATVGANGVPVYSDTWVDGGHGFAGGAAIPNMVNPAYEAAGWDAATQQGIPQYVDIPGARPVNDVVFNDVLQPLVGGIDTFVRGLGGSIQGMSFGLGWSRDPEGSAPDQMLASVADASGNVIYSHSGEIGGVQQTMPLEMKRMTLAAVDAANINPIFESIVHGVDLATASAEKLDETFAKLAAAQQAIDLAQMMGMDEASYTALLSNTKDIAGLNASMGTYFQNYYSQEKQRQGLMDSMSAQFDKLGVTMPLTKDGFVDLMDGLDLTTEAGRATYNALLALSPAFLQVADAAQQAAQQAMGFDAAGLGQMLLDAAFNPAAGMTAAESFSQSLETSVRQALISSTVGNIATSIYNAIVVPMVAGAAVSDAAIGQVVAKAQAAISTLGLVLQNLDLTAITSAARAILPSLQSFAPAASATSAAVRATAAAQQQSAVQAAAAVKSEWQSVADAILDTMRELRGEILDDSRNFAAEQARFAMATAAARAGDRSAAEQLPSLARSVVDLGKAVTATAADQALLTAQTLASLRTTVEGIGSKYGIQIPAFAGGGEFGGGLRLVGERGPEIEATGPARIFSNDQLREALQGGNVAEEVRALRVAVNALLEESNTLQRANVKHNFKTAKILERITPDGDAMATRTAA